MNVTLISTGLSPEEVSKHIEEGRFEDVVPLESGTAEIPLSDRPGQSGYLLVSSPHSTLSLSLFTCRFADCEQASELAASLLGGAAGTRPITLPEGASVSDVRYGDANEDGLTDILVVLSTGGGILYQQASGSRATTPPPPRPVPWASPARRAPAAAGPVRHEGDL